MTGGYTGTRREPAGIVHRGEYFMPDGEGGFVHAYHDNELIYHYSSYAELMAALEDDLDLED